MASYDHKKIEKKWQKEWEKSEIYKTPDEQKSKDNFYALVEFPYPSGNLHTGHWYAFSVPDIFTRKKRMEGKNVLFPIGFDAFGLPAENAAIQRGLSPKKWTYENMDYMRKQIKSIGASFDWSREVITADPEYYKWTQWIFLKFFEKGLAYQAETPVNWCPKDKTVLANEQVVGGHCERCGTEVIQKNMKQWMLKITDYAEKLLEGLEKLNWKDEIKEAQRNWIGKSEGAEIEFEIKDNKSKIKIFTTRPDTLFGATYMVLAPEHPFIENHKSQVTNYKEVEKYINQAKKKTQLQRQKEEKEKTGIELKSIKAINPANNEEISVWVADYVFSGYGTGAIMAVPAHDERDFGFAKKFKLPVKHVIAWESGSKREREERRDGGCAVIFDHQKQKYAFGKTPEGILDLFGGGVGNEDLTRGIKREIEEESGLHDFVSEELLDEALVHYFNYKKKVPRLARATCLLLVLGSDKLGKIAQEDHEDYKILWLDPEEAISYWEERNKDSDYTHWIRFLKRGVNWLVMAGIDTTNKLYPEPTVHTGKGILVNSGKFDGMDSENAKWKIIKFVSGKKAIQYRLRDWVVSRQRYWGAPIPIIHCEKCGTQTVPEKDLPVLLPEIKDYKPYDDGKSPLAKAGKWLKVKCPKCGGEAERETDTLDTFVDSSWYFLRYCDPINKKEFASSAKMKTWMPVDLYSGGAEHTTMHLLYSRFWFKAMFDLGLIPKELGDEPYKERRNRGIILGPDGQKMSKSKGNVVDPDEYVAKFGADTVRMYLAFIGPYNEVGSYPWNPQAILGIRRFLDRVWKIASPRSSTLGVFEDSTPSVLPRGDSARLLNKTINKVGDDIEEFHFNTAISALMMLLNEMEKAGVSSENFSVFLKLLAPFAPHLAEELWSKLGNKNSIHFELWPEYNPKLIEETTFELIVQINGKVRDKFEVPADILEAEATHLTLEREKVKLALENKKPRRIIFIPKRLISLVL